MPQILNLQPSQLPARERAPVPLLVALSCLFVFSPASGVPAESLSSPSFTTNVQTFDAKGVVVALDYSRNTLTIRHEAISNYMPAMTMPFHAKSARELEGISPRDQVSFRLLVSDTESWVEGVKKTGTVPAEEVRHEEGQAPASRHPLLTYKFTNELGQAVSLSDFRGQALGITFFFTRCPLPEFCPRLSKNFYEASRELSAMANAPTNWHFLSISFDPQFDTPAVLKAYGESYQYDPAHWNFLTGPEDKIRELARLSGVEVKPAGALIDHNFRTLIIDATGHLQTTIPFGGNLSDFIVKEMLKAAVAVPASNAGGTNGTVPQGPRSTGFSAAAATLSR